MSDKICNSQDDFNVAFEGAVKYVEKKQRPSKFIMIISLIIMITLIIWALSLANKIASVKEKLVHFILAILVSPVYIIAYYIDNNI